MLGAQVCITHGYVQTAMIQYLLKCNNVAAISDKVACKPAIRQTKEYYKIIADHKIKDKKELSDFVFRSNKQQEQYEKFGILQKGITSVYKPEAVDFIVEIYKKDYLFKQNYFSRKNIYFF